jgi:hypothetical protein
MANAVPQNKCPHMRCRECSDVAWFLAVTISHGRFLDLFGFGVDQQLEVNGVVAAIISIAFFFVPP